MAPRSAVIGSLLLLISVKGAATSLSATSCSQQQDPRAAVEDGQGMELLQKAAVEQRNQMQKQKQQEGMEIRSTKVNATKQAAEQAEHAQEAALMEKLTKNLNVNVVDQIQAELTMDDTVMKDKLVLSLLELLAITSLCGVDRCFMGQVCLGTVKGLTLGGLGIWATIDWFVVIINCLGSWDSIYAFGFRAHFYPKTVQPAYVLALIGMIIYLVNVCCCGGYYSKKTPEAETSSKEADAADEGAGSPTAPELSRVHTVLSARSASTLAAEQTTPSASK